MDLAERISCVEQLRASRDELREALQGISEEQAKFKPSPDCWSIEEIVEHLAVAEHGMYRLITAHYEPLDAPADREREKTIVERGRTRAEKIEAPERVRPRGRYGSLSAALEQFNANRERTIQYVESCEDDLRMRATQHALGRISCQECLSVLIVHPLRHAEQIKEIRERGRI
jgi:uncharacterized damage-inducible protein DinB